MDIREIAATANQAAVRRCFAARHSSPRGFAHCWHVTLLPPKNPFGSHWLGPLSSLSLFFISIAQKIYLFLEPVTSAEQLLDNRLDGRFGRHAARGRQETQIRAQAASSRINLNLNGTMRKPRSEDANVVTGVFGWLRG